jgi:hypothetical protein
MPKGRIADDLLRGTEAIAEFLDFKVHQTGYMIKRKQIPAFQVGKTWFARKSQLDAFFQSVLTAGEQDLSNDASRETGSYN